MQHVVEVSENEAKNKLYDQFMKVALTISDEILETIEEVDDES